MSRDKLGADPAKTAQRRPIRGSELPSITAALQRAVGELVATAGVDPADVPRELPTRRS